MLERDERPLSEIRFAQDKDAPLYEDQVRSLFAKMGVSIGQDIIGLGCTGLATKATPATAQNLRKSMAGSICGLPCYVPNHLFCLVHNTVGGLQESGNKDGPQRNPHPEGLEMCSRPLTPEEGGKIQGVHAFIAAEGVKEAVEHFGAERAEAEATLSEASATDFATCPVPLPPFVCREHTEFNPGCRYCLAQSIVEGPFEPPVRLFAEAGGIQSEQAWFELPKLLASDDTDIVELYVLAGRWVRKLTKV
jgi:hypothetical protein